MAGTRGNRHPTKPCTKTASFPTEAAALAELDQVRDKVRQDRDRQRQRRRERRVFYCPVHDAWHWTSQKAMRL